MCARDPLITAIIVLIILVIGFRLAFRILPPWVGKLTSDVLNLVIQFVLGILNFVLQLVLGTSIKGKK